MNTLTVISVMALIAGVGGSYINEYPHAPLSVHFHPTTAQFMLDDLVYALHRNVQAVELDLHLRKKDGQVVCNHDHATNQSPTLKESLDVIFRKQGGAGTVNHDGLQFFIVLEPKEESPELFDAICRVLGNYKDRLSTAVGPEDKPRGVTVVITGSHVKEFHSHFPDTIDRLCIVEGVDYSLKIRNMSSHGTHFGWVSIRHSKKEGEDRRRVLLMHSKKFNVRIWDCHADLEKALSCGADSLNCDRDEILPFKRLLERAHSD